MVKQSNKEHMTHILSKPSQLIVGTVVMLLMIGIAGVVAAGVAQKKLIAPTAPESQPAAASCSLKFVVSNTSLPPTTKPGVMIKSPGKSYPVGAPVKSAY
jgi:hypothetical protein